jgi:hypothetical protein
MTDEVTETATTYNLENLFGNWLWTSEIGDTLVYFQGNLAASRQRHPQIDAGAKALWQGYMDGLIHLTQRRLSDTGYDYIATRCARKPVTEKMMFSASVMSK